MNDVDNMPLASEKCQRLQDPSKAEFIISCLLMVWVLISYIPQYARIVSRRSAEGLSSLYVLLGSLSGVCAVGNIMMLPSSWVEFHCCRDAGITRFACLNGVIGTFQILFGVLCSWVVLFMYVYYSEDEASAELQGHRPSVSGPARTFRRARRAWLTLLTTCIFGFVVALISATISHLFPLASQTWATILGVAVAALACGQWIPQMLKTWKLGHLGSLSLISLGLSVPCTWVFAITLIKRMGRAGWSVWIVYVLVGTMQVILTIMGIIIKMKGETPARPMDEVQQVRPGPLIKIRFEGSWNTSGQFGSGAGARDGGRRRRSYALLSRGIAPDEKIRPLLLFSDPTLRYTTKNPPVERNLLTSSARSPAPSRLNRGANGGDGFKDTVKSLSVFGKYSWNKDP